MPRRTGPTPRHRTDRPDTDLDLIRVQVQTLYRLDASGRLLGPNEPQSSPPPRFFLGRTAHGNAWYFGAEMPAALAERLGVLAAAEPVGDDWRLEPRCAAAVRALLAPTRREWRGPAYR